MGVTRIWWATALAICLSSCISIDRDSRRGHLHDFAGDELFASLQVGATSRSELMARIGSPDAVWQTEGAAEIMRYDNVRERRTQVAAWPLLDVDVRSEEVQRYFFELNDGVLVRYWRDNE